MLVRLLNFLLEKVFYGAYIYAFGVRLDGEGSDISLCRTEVKAVWEGNL